MVTKLPQQIEEEIQRLVDTGEFEDSTAVLVQGVGLVSKRREQTEHLRKLLQVGIDQIERGELREFTPAVREQLWENAKRRHEAGEKPSADVCP